MHKQTLKLYICGQTANSQTAVANLRAVCEEELDNQYEIVVIDILEHPQLAVQDKILATPTLTKSLPLPVRKIIGDLSDKEKVLIGLDLTTKEKQLKR